MAGTWARKRRGALGLLAGVAMGLAGVSGVSAWGQDIENEPIRYSESTPRNVVSQLEERLERGEAALEYGAEHGRLEALLEALDIPESSQVLVFSKTSLQRERIAPKTPRAVYFNDDVMVGYCLRGRVIEISAVDDRLGTVYYTLDQAREAEERVPVRQTESCLICHGSSANQGVPGHLVRSLTVDRTGNPEFSRGSFRTEHSSPLAERWGGWYVTGTSGAQRHMGNVIGIPDAKGHDRAFGDGVNVVDLVDRFTVGMYPTPHSDIVALMVLEHQVGMLNRLARANLETQAALHYEVEFNKAMGRGENEESESARSRIRSVGDAVVDHMLFHDETKLTDEVTGTSMFATEFMARGPRDSKGRSLRDLDLKTRLFRYPCSYLIYSRAFRALPADVKAHVYQRLWDILNGRVAKKDPTIAPVDARAIIEILRETKDDLPEYWRSEAAVVPAG